MATKTNIAADQIMIPTSEALDIWVWLSAPSNSGMFPANADTTTDIIKKLKYCPRPIRPENLNGLIGCFTAVELLVLRDILYCEQRVGSGSNWNQPTLFLLYIPYLAVTGDLT
jgi:hypothetical protein